MKRKCTNTTLNSNDKAKIEEVKMLREEVSTLKADLHQLTTKLSSVLGVLTKIVQNNPNLLAGSVIEGMDLHDECSSPFKNFTQSPSPPRLFSLSRSHSLAFENTFDDCSPSIYQPDQKKKRYNDFKGNSFGSMDLENEVAHDFSSPSLDIIDFENYDFEYSGGASQQLVICTT